MRALPFPRAMQNAQSVRVFSGHTPSITPGQSGSPWLRRNLPHLVLVGWLRGHLKDALQVVPVPRAFMHEPQEAFHAAPRCGAELCQRMAQVAVPGGAGGAAHVLRHPLHRDVSDVHALEEARQPRLELPVPPGNQSGCRGGNGVVPTVSCRRPRCCCAVPAAGWACVRALHTRPGASEAQSQTTAPAIMWWSPRMPNVSENSHLLASGGQRKWQPQVMRRAAALLF